MNYIKHLLLQRLIQVEKSIADYQESLTVAMKYRHHFKDTDIEYLQLQINELQSELYQIIESLALIDNIK